MEEKKYPLGYHPNSLKAMEGGWKTALGKQTGPKTKIGKFRMSLNAVRGNKSNKYMDIPEEIRDLYNWAKQYDTKELNELIELKNIYFVIQNAQIPEILKKALNNESLSKKDIDALRLMADINVSSHKLKYGDKKTVEHHVNVDDIRKQMMSDKKIIDAEVLNETQNSDRSGRSSGIGSENRETEENNGSA